MLSQKIGAGSTGWELVTGVGDLAGARRRFEFQAKRSRKRVTEQRTAERYPGGARDAPRQKHVNAFTAFLLYEIGDHPRNLLILVLVTDEYTNYTHIHPRSLKSSLDI